MLSADLMLDIISTRSRNTPFHNTENHKNEFRQGASEHNNDEDRLSIAKNVISKARCFLILSPLLSLSLPATTAGRYGIEPRL